MTRVSQEELYNDKDVITQILKLKDTVNDYAGGIIENIDVSGNNLVIDWASGESISLPLPNPTGISSIAGVVFGGNLTITIYMTDGSSHAFTTPLAGMASEAYVDALDAQNVKKTGSVVTGALEVPTTPPTPTSAVNDVYVNDATPGTNNLFHKTGNETADGEKKLLKPALILDKAIASNSGSTTVITEVIRATIDREMILELITSFARVSLHATLTPSNFTNTGGNGIIFKVTGTLTLEIFATDNGDGTVSLWVKSNTAYTAFVVHNKNWYNNFGVEDGYTTPNAKTETDPRGTLPYKTLTLMTAVLQ